MKRIIKNNLRVVIAIIITAIVCISTTAYAAYNHYAKDISFTPSNESWKVENVEDAINDLYLSKKTNMKYVTSAAMDGDRTVTVNKFEVGEYYMCTANTRGLINTYSVTGADVIQEVHNHGLLDYLYSNYITYIKAESTTINFSYTSNSSNKGIVVQCYQFE